MEIICVYCSKKADSGLKDSEFIAFFQPAWAGNEIVEAILITPLNNIRDYENVEIFYEYKDAHRKAHLTQMSEEDYSIIHS